MALSQATLKAELLKLIDQDSPTFIGFPATKEQACENWANAYDVYCQSAQDISNDGLATSNPTGFKNSLIANLPEGAAGSAALGAAAFESAVVAYWTGATFNIGSLPPGGIGGTGVFSIEISSVVTEITPNVLYDLLLIEFSKTTFELDMDVKADTLAALFHTFTTTAVIVTISGSDTTPPPPGGTGPLPVVNISPIH